MSQAATGCRSGPGTSGLLRRFDPDVAGKGSLNVHGIWIDADENIYLAQFDRTVSKLTKVKA